MNDFTTLKENKDLIIACLVTGTILGVIAAMLAVKLKEPLMILCTFIGVCWMGFWGLMGKCWTGLWGWVGCVLWGIGHHSYAMWMVFSLQIGLEIFLLQQWIFTYNAVGGGDGGYDRYSYVPLTVSIPCFVTNVFVVIATCGRLGQLHEQRK